MENTFTGGSLMSEREAAFDSYVKTFQEYLRLLTSEELSKIIATVTFEVIRREAEAKYTASQN